MILLFAVGIQLRNLVQTSLDLFSSHQNENRIRHQQSWIPLAFVTSLSSFDYFVGKGYNHATKSPLPLPPPISIESWVEWEQMFRANNTMLLEQLEKSSVYGSTIYINADGDDSIQCDQDYLREYMQATKPATNLIALPNCSWPETMHEWNVHQYPWTSSFSLQESHVPWSEHGSPCPLVHFSSPQACQLLRERIIGGPKNQQNQHPILLLFIGDSLIRHVLIGLGIILTDNMQSGGIQYIHSNPQKDLDYVWKRACSCENQFVCATLKQEQESRFTHAFGYDNDTFVNHVDWCRGNNDDSAMGRQRPEQTYQIILEQQNNNPKISPMVRQLLRHATSHHRHIVIVTDASALHSGLNIRKTRRFLNKLENLLLLSPEDDKSSNSLIIPMTVHYVGPNKPKEFLEYQGRQPVEVYNEQLRTLTEQKGNRNQNNNYHLLDTYHMTQGLPSNDGTHYPTASVSLAQILLHYIRDYLPARRNSS